MLTNIKISNFKCFQKTDLNFKALTVLAGGNACGKSSIIQILRYLCNLHYQNHKWRINTKLDDIDFGTANDMFSDSATEEKIQVDFTSEDEDYNLILSSNSKNRYELLVDGKNLSALKKFTVFYLNAERRSPKTLHEISDNATLYVGSHGEYTISLFNYLLLQSRDEKSDCYGLDKLHQDLRKSDDKLIKSFDQLCDKWLSYITDSTQLFIESIDNVPYNKLKIKNINGAYVPAATGFGISYCLPIIVQGLACALNNQSIFIVENPEAHLHPKGQSHMGEFLALLALSGIQVIVETHSEHIINGIRLAMCIQGATDSSNIYFFSHNNNKFDQTEITINKFGELSEWPCGFFDQTENDIRELLKRKFAQDES